MKITFTAKFTTERKRIFSELDINDVFLNFLPRKLGIKQIAKSSWDNVHHYQITMVTTEVFTIEEIVKSLKEWGIHAFDFKEITREFSDKELEKLKAKLALKKIFASPKGARK